MEIENRTQWHSAFCTSMELELMENERALLYDREHNLGSEPLQIDLLIIRKEPHETIKNEIGAIFLGHNIVEFKSPDDGMNIDTFYKVIAYACLYKADTGAVDEVLDTDITVTLIREQKPVKLLSQLSEKYRVTTGGNGIYYIEDMLFPMQIVATKELDSSAHVWLKALTRSMDINQADELLDRYESLKDNEKYYSKAETIVNLASDVNTKIFEEIVLGGGIMSDALKEMLLPELGELKRQLAESSMELAENRAELAENRAELAENRAELAENRAKLAENKAELARKDAIIAELKRVLTEVGQSMDKEEQ